MLIGGIALGLVLGLVLGGKLERLAEIRLQFLPLLFVAVIIRYGTEALLGAGVDIVETLRMPLLAVSYGLLLFTLWQNRTYPGLALAFVGIALNGLVILVNGGRRAVWGGAGRWGGRTGRPTPAPPAPSARSSTSRCSGSTPSSSSGSGRSRTSSPSPFPRSRTSPRSATCSSP